MHCWLDGNKTKIRHKNETKPKSETKQNCGQNNLSHAKFCVFPLLLSCSDSALPKCPGHFLFWKVYILGFSHGMVECYFIRNKWVSKLNWRRPFKELLRLVLWHFSLLDMLRFAKVFGREGVAILKTGLKIIPNHTVLTSKGTRLLQMIFTLDVLLWTLNFELEN